MKNISIKNKGENNKLIDNKLSILITQDGLSYSLYSVLENRYNTLVAKTFSQKDNYIEEIKKILTEEELTNKDFKQVNIVVSGNRTTIIPNVLFSKNEYEKIYYLNFGVPENQNIYYSQMPKSANTLIYSADKALINMLDNIFLKYSLYSHAEPFVESNFTKNKISENRDKTKVFIQVFENFTDILVFKNEKILLYNTFKYKTNNDLLYHIINVFEQLKLSPEETEVSLSGFIETDDLVVIHLRKFVRIVYFESLNTEFKYFYKFQEIQPHYFINFLNIIKCE
ncbi:MAG: DUF3822 family protein [Bacteroidales bacterium]|jgi:hypothetical protein|nr:DUF3822 family protein [Bacteroidales bacterium]